MEIINTKLLSYAKVNWVLEIISKREDGYHNISSIFDLINFYDEIDISIASNRTWDIKIVSNVTELEKDNIIYKIFDYISELIKDRYQVLIKLTKNIPLGGGLGGGSSNAATLIYFLYKNKIIDLIQAMKISKISGSDVLPIFLCYLYKNSYIICLEKQNICLPLEKKKMNLNAYLIISDTKVETKKAYICYDEKKPNKSNHWFIGTRTYRFINFLNSSLFQDFSLDLLYNDFEEVIYRMYPEIYGITEKIYSNFGKESLRVLLCGSGSSLLVLSQKKIDLSFINQGSIKVIEVGIC